jgi:uncharacterized protein
MKISSTEPLNIQEFEELDRLLLGSANEADCMDAVMLDGFIAAIVCTRNSILPSAWMTRIWDVENGMCKPIFNDKKQAEKTFALLIRHMNDISQTINQSPSDFEPLLSESLISDHPIPNLNEWCLGFVKGLQLNRKYWDQLLDQRPELISTIWLFGTEEGSLQLEKKYISPEESIRLANELPATVIDIHNFFSEKYPNNLAENIFPHSAAISEEFFNLDELCHCGSGKKSSLCHGAKSRLH